MLVISGLCLSDLDNALRKAMIFSQRAMLHNNVLMYEIETVVERNANKM